MINVTVGVGIARKLEAPVSTAFALGVWVELNSVVFIFVESIGAAVDCSEEIFSLTKVGVICSSVFRVSPDVQDKLSSALISNRRSLRFIGCRIVSGFLRLHIVAIHGRG